MSNGLNEKLSPEKALIFRITHIGNVPWILENGLCASQHPNQDADFRSIGLPDLIEARKQREIPAPPGGTLADYVPFYFTPYSPMALNIVTGRNVPPQPRQNLAVIVSSLHRARELECAFVVADRHAYLSTARFTNDIKKLDEWVPWDLLRTRNFSHDPENPEKIERYQAEALIHWHLPVDALFGVVVYNDEADAWLRARVGPSIESVRLVVQPGWFF